MPAEKHYGDKRSFQEKGQEAFYGQGSTENVPDKPGIIRPVGAELKLQNQTGGNADGKVYTEQLHPEFGGSQPLFFACSHPCGLHNGNQKGQTEGQGNKHVMVDGGHGKLPARPLY